MALPNSGPLTLEMIRAEFGGGYPISLSQYYRGGGLTTTNNTNVPTSGTISVSNFYGAQKYIPGNQVFETVGWNTFNVPSYVSQITVYALGGGGGGGAVWGNGDCRDQGGGGGGGSSGQYYESTHAVTPGSVLSVLVGYGGPAGQYPGGTGGAGGTTGIDGLFFISGGAGGGGGSTCSYFTNGQFYGGGGSVGPGSNAGQGGYKDGYYYRGGVGGNSPWGTGGSGGVAYGGRGDYSGGPGGNASGFGAGGGAAADNAMAYAGGNGSQGRVHIFW